MTTIGGGLIGASNSTQHAENEKNVLDPNAFLLHPQAEPENF